MAEETLGASFSIDVTNLKAGLNQANAMIRESESEFKAAAASMDDWTDSQEGLEARIKHLNNAQDLQTKKVKALQEQYKELGYSADDMSASAVKLRTQINKEKEALAKTEKELKKQEKALDGVKEASEDAKKKTIDLGKAFDGLKKTAGVAVGAIAGIGTACVGAVTGFLALAESTRETRTALGKLEQSFDTAGFSAETTSATMNDLYGVLGDTDKAVESASLIAKMSKDEEDLAKNSRILTGVFAEFGDSIPTEGLAEGMNATAKMGEVQGVLADALEWQGVNLEDFNDKLGALNSEEERAALIQETLTGLYGESADAYRETNKDLIEANESQMSLNETMAELGAIAEPIMTTLKTLTADLLTEMTPFVTLIGEGLSGALEGADGSAEKLADGLSGLITSLLDKVIEMIPFVIDTIVAIVPKLLSALLEQLPTILTTVVDAVVQIINALTKMTPQIIEAIMQVLPLLIASLIDAIPQLLEAAIKLFMALVDALPYIITELINALPLILKKLIPALMSMRGQLISAAIQLFFSLVEGMIKIIPDLIKNIPLVLGAIVKGFSDGIGQFKEIGEDLVKGLWDGIKNTGKWLEDKIKGFGKDIVDGFKDIFGIHSPSKLMADVVGKNLALGIGEGFTDNIGDVNKEISKAMDFEDANLNINSKANKGTRTGNGNGGVVVYQTNNYSQAHSQLELYKSKQATAAAVRLALGGI